MAMLGRNTSPLKAISHRTHLQRGHNNPHKLKSIWPAGRMSLALMCVCVHEGGFPYTPLTVPTSPAGHCVQSYEAWSKYHSSVDLDTNTIKIKMKIMKEQLIKIQHYQN